MAPLSLQAPSRGSVVSLDSASAAPSRAVEVPASCTRARGGSLTRRELTRPPMGVDEPASPGFTRSAEKPLQWRRSRAVSSVGRAPRLHRGGRRFEPVTAHLHPRCTACPRVRFDGRCRPSPAGSSFSGCCSRSRRVLPRARLTRHLGVQYGIQDDTWLEFGPGKLDQRMATFRRLGVPLVRFTLRWNEIALRRPKNATAPTDRAYDWHRPGQDPAWPSPSRPDACAHGRRDAAMGQRRALAEFRAAASPRLQPVRDCRCPPIPLGAVLADLERAEQASVAAADEAADLRRAPAQSRLRGDPCRAASRPGGRRRDWPARRKRRRLARRLG